jgi:hypothetical protein
MLRLSRTLARFPRSSTATSRFIVSRSLSTVATAQKVEIKKDPERDL